MNAEVDHVNLEQPKLVEFCRRWQITELALFGSALRDDFTIDSDLDFLVRFSAQARWSVVDHVHMQRELSELVGRPADLVTRKAIERSRNWIRRREILDSARVIYAAA